MFQINYVVACILCIFIFLAFQQKAFISAENFPCLVALLMLYGWAMTPLMYVGAYLFKVPSSAIVGLSCGNIFLGFISTIATFILEVMAAEEGVSNDLQCRGKSSEVCMQMTVVEPFCLSTNGGVRGTAVVWWTAAWSTGRAISFTRGA